VPAIVFRSGMSCLAADLDAIAQPTRIDRGYVVYLAILIGFVAVWKERTGDANEGQGSRLC